MKITEDQLLSLFKWVGAKTHTGISNETADWLLSEFKDGKPNDWEIVSDDNTRTEPALPIQSVSNLLPCPFCGSEVIEGSLSWNMAHAECTKCSATWGHCGSKYEGRFDKWNVRAR